MRIVSDHGFPVASNGNDANAFDAFKNERDYIAQSRDLKNTVAAMDWAAREIERLRVALDKINNTSLDDWEFDNGNVRGKVHLIAANALNPSDRGETG